jgi:hypothetical protein
MQDVGFRRAKPEDFAALVNPAVGVKFSSLILSPSYFPLPLTVLLDCIILGRFRVGVARRNLFMQIMPEGEKK